MSAEYKNKNPLILGIPRGALPMVEVIADALGGELDVVLVHKLGHPDQPEFAIMIAALRAVRVRQPKKLICAVAVSSPDAAAAILREADKLVCLTVPADFFAVGEYFEEFAQVTDEEVAVILQRHKASAAVAS
jgi:predicted phosphoribosyltransferase